MRLLFLLACVVLWLPCSSVRLPAQDSAHWQSRRSTRGGSASSSAPQAPSSQNGSWRAHGSGHKHSSDGSKAGGKSGGSRSSSSFGVIDTIANLRAVSKRRKAGQRERHHGEAESGFLRRATVKPITRERYATAHAEVVAFARRSSLPVLTDSEFDVALNAYLENLFLRGEAVSTARYAIYGSAFVRDMASRSPTTFPLGKKALAGFAKLCPEHSRDPTPLALFWLVISVMLNKSPPRAKAKRWLGLMPFAAAALLVSFDCYLRPGEALRLDPSVVHVDRTLGDHVIGQSRDSSRIP